MTADILFITLLTLKEAFISSRDHVEFLTRNKLNGVEEDEERCKELQRAIDYFQSLNVILANPCATRE